ncbi:MAG: archease [Desulfuromonadales bacterium]|nr:archease [Desulfuromonadales bacterium]NIS43290.1 archease [Desulfuromonadales bacterium]
MTESYNLIEHTADIGLEARADTLPGLFVAAGCGLREVLSASEEATPDQTISVTLEAGDCGELLVNWLNEILFLLESRHLFPVDFLIDSVDAGHLEARVHGFAFDTDTAALDREVKAATYHQLRVEMCDDGTWYARVYLDL